MKALSLETTKLLDKMYNLRGKDSVILVEMDKQKDKAEKTLERTTEEKSNLQGKIAKLETQHEELENQGEKLKEVLSGIDRNEFATVLDSLKIDFDPVALMGKVNENLPKTIDKVSNEMKTAEKELISVEEEMNNAITTIQELGIRKDAALSNQDKLNEYFDLALNGKINITRDSITSLLEQFDFSEEEQREAAKILMFPEDALYIYDNKLNNNDVVGKSISEVIAEAKDAIENDENLETEEELQLENIEIEPIKEIDDAAINPFIIDDTITNTTVEEPIFEEQVFETQSEENLTHDEEKDLDLSLNIDDFVPVNTSEDDTDTFEESLNKMGINYLDFSSQELDDLKSNYNKELFIKNIEFIKNNNIDLDIFIDHASLLYDEELSQKIELLLNIGKEPIDIYLNPSILVKYTIEKLNNAITLLTSNGMDPKNVPLMAY